MEFGQWVWWLCAALVAAYFTYGTFNARQIQLAPCQHGTARAKKNRKLCHLCMAEDDSRRKAEVEKRKAEEETRCNERAKEYRQYLRNIRLPTYLQEMHPLDFEMLACDLHARMGYEVETTPFSGDSGADGFLRKDGELTILQAKRVQGSVGEPILRDLFGTMHSFDAKFGVVVTTGKVSEQARNWSANKPIRIIELAELTSLIRQYFPEDDVVPSTFAVPQDSSELCPECHRPLSKRKGSHGRFLGCSGYPACRYTRNLKRR
jgi:restriction endonuclease Mrr